MYVGDALWAMMIYLVVAMLFPRVAGWKLWLMTLLGCLAMEMSQLYQAEWINRIRHLPGMGLLLGYGFLWSDLIAYTLGVSAGFGLDVLILRFTSPSPSKPITQ